MTRDDSSLQDIQRRLDGIETREGVKIHFACEAGSRAWGFASSDSDYDIRFLYLRPRSWYLSIDVEHRPSVLEWPPDGVWDIAGWDLRKALRLIAKSNPQLLEWLHSPIVYRDLEATGERLRKLLPQVYSPERAMHHYLHMAIKNRRVYLEAESIRWKKSFEVLRPLLAYRWTEAGRGIVPVQFERLLEVDSIDPPLVTASENSSMPSDPASSAKERKSPRSAGSSRSSCSAWRKPPGPFPRPRGPSSP